MNVQVIAPGMLSSLQAGARCGFRHLGVGAAGALDSYSFAVANMLVGNPHGATVLEITLAGPTLLFDEAVRIAICGASIETTMDGLALPGWRRIDLPAGSQVKFGACRQGARAYLAVAGGFAGDAVLGSASTDLRGGFGGLLGRALKAGDRLRVAGDARAPGGDVAIDTRWIDPGADLDLDGSSTVRVLPGNAALSEPEALHAEPWRIDPASNRQGLRLSGIALRAIDTRERISEPVLPGTLQLPADGKPILLLADAQTHGGYPRIAHAIRADLPRLAQLRPGDSLRLCPCSPESARRLYLEQQQRLVRMQIALSQDTTRAGKISQPG
jgi:antagonist of KipI